MTDANRDVEVLVESASESVRDLVEALRAKMKTLLPDAVEEPDSSARLIGYTFQPGTYRGLVAAIALHSTHVNLMFSKGVELLDSDPAGLLEGTGKKARHIRLTDPSVVDRDEIDTLILEAARRTRP